MQDLTTRLSKLTRPRLLVRAARLGSSHYQRERTLAKLLPPSLSSRPAVIVAHLLDLEHAYNQKRLTHEIGYSFARHIELLIALQAETHLLRASRASEPLKALEQKNGPQMEAAYDESVDFALRSYENASGMDAFFSAT